ncbi:hypothetical protein HMPREF1549_03240 [Actinomyces johnsonii F0510]|uniref:Uncharacterized protein n=1 Tax=Actinomyces johnsonii F0510 TaxID=1227262 RepID=U1R785_9ACTO|nr:hypothetical protein HMPREF1549_03240 [Actinomyces johnsonii F0510]
MANTITCAQGGWKRGLHRPHSLSRTYFMWFRLRSRIHSCSETKRRE